MSNFKPAPENSRLYIASHDSDIKAKVVAQYNPKELQIDKKIPWSKHSYTNKGNDQAKNGRGHIAYEFTGAEGRTMTVELLFDAFGDPSNQVDVPAQVAELEKLAAVKDPSSPSEDKRRPPMCIVAWGEGGMPSFTCIIMQLTTKYTMFNEKGYPLRATCTVQLQEADILSTKDAEHKDADAKAGAKNDPDAAKQGGTAGAKKT